MIVVTIRDLFTGEQFVTWKRVKMNIKCDNLSNLLMY